MFDFRSNYMKLLLVLSLLAAVGSWVAEKHRTYSCSDRKLPFDPQCEHLWSIHQSNFAQAGSECECHHPCEWIQNGVMKLKECVAVNQTSTCLSEEERLLLVKEERTYYSTQPWSAAPPSARIQGSFCLLLLKVLQLSLV